MRFLLLTLALLLLFVPGSLAQDGFPPCWTTELDVIDVAAHYQDVHYSLLAKVETAEDLVDFAEGYLALPRAKLGEHAPLRRGHRIGLADAAGDQPARGLQGG